MTMDPVTAYRASALEVALNHGCDIRDGVAYCRCGQWMHADLDDIEPEYRRHLGTAVLADGFRLAMGSVRP